MKISWKLKIKLKNHQIWVKRSVSLKVFNHTIKMKLMWSIKQHFYLNDNHESIMISYNATITSYFKRIRHLRFLNCSQMLENHQIWFEKIETNIGIKKWKHFGKKLFVKSGNLIKNGKLSWKHQIWVKRPVKTWLPRKHQVTWSKS